MTKRHDFRKQLAQGKKGEKELDEFFKKDYIIVPVELQDEKDKGIDRVFIDRKQADAFTVEYKTDFLTQYTNNIAVEIYSVLNNKTDKRGWAYTSKADYIFYYIFGKNEILVFEPKTMHEHLCDWERDYRHVFPNNGSYSSECVLVPVKVFLDCVDRIIQIKD